MYLVEAMSNLSAGSYVGRDGEESLKNLHHGKELVRGTMSLPRRRGAEFMHP